LGFIQFFIVQQRVNYHIDSCPILVRILDEPFYICDGIAGSFSRAKVRGAQIDGICPAVNRGDSGFQVFSG